MDPDLVLNQLRGAIVAHDIVWDNRVPEFDELVDIAERLSTLAFDLDKWLINGGALPKSWSTKR